MYSSQVLDHFQNPRSAGDLPDATVTGEVQNPACGDVMQLSLKIVDGCIVDAAFRAKGCVPSIACGSALVEMVRGQSLASAAAITREQIIEQLGGLPPASSHAAQLAIDAVKAALAVSREQPVRRGQL